jgi:hypothetical protein
MGIFSMNSRPREDRAELKSFARYGSSRSGGYRCSPRSPSLFAFYRNGVCMV